MKTWHCVIVGVGLLSPVSFGIDWGQKLASGDPASIAGEAEFRDDTEAFLQELEGSPELDAHFSFLRRCLPGGHLWASLSEESRALAVELAVKAPQPKHRRETFFRLRRAQALSQSEEFDKMVEDALASIPAAEWPEGFAPDNANANEIDAARMAAGKAVYNRIGICTTCHQADGKGMPGAFPPLAGSPWMDGDVDRLIKIVLKGMIGPIKVGDEDYNSAMLPLEAMLTDEDIADVLTYVQNEWGNTGPAVSKDKVASVRKAVKGQVAPWNPEELLKMHPLK